MVLHGTLCIVSESPLLVDSTPTAYGEARCIPVSEQKNGLSHSADASLTLFKKRILLFCPSPSPILLERRQGGSGGNEDAFFEYWEGSNLRMAQTVLLFWNLSGQATFWSVPFNLCV